MGIWDERKGQSRSRSYRSFHHLALGEAGFRGYNLKLIAATWEVNYVVLSCKGINERPLFRKKYLLLLEIGLKLSSDCRNNT